MGRGLDSFTVKEAEEYLNGIPKFTRKKHSIEELREILDETGLSLDSVRLIHVAGTNGKGSVCAFCPRFSGKPGSLRQCLPLLTWFLSESGLSLTENRWKRRNFSQHFAGYSSFFP